MPRLRKLDLVDVIPLIKRGPRGLPGETKIVREVVEKPSVDLKPLRDEVEDLKKKVRETERALNRPIQFPGGSQTGTYHRVTSNTMSFSRHSFLQGVNIIGVASGEATTIYLPRNMDPTHLVCVKDELGVAGAATITVMVSPT
jgi:hypothetical protein